MAKRPETPVKSSLAPSIGSATGNPRNKVALKAGRSLMDWIRLGHSVKDLAGTGGKVMQVTQEELAKHNDVKDAWICLKGKVYNVTPYMEYHPGGEDELLKGVGQDATALFNSVHQWVNAEGMLQKCFIGYLDASPLSRLIRPKLGVAITREIKKQLPKNGEKATMEPCPRWTWDQTETNATVRIQALPPMTWQLQEQDVMYSHNEDHLSIRLLFPQHVYLLALALPAEIEDHLKVDIKNDDQPGTVEVCLMKVNAAMWSDIKVIDVDTAFLKKDDPRYLERMRYHRCIFTAKYPISHDTRLFQFELPPGTRMSIPVGKHVSVRAQVEGVEVVRNYTPVTQTINQKEEDRQKIYLMIKIYPLGILTHLLDDMHTGTRLDISDPMGNFELVKLRQYHHLGMLAAGTGLTPMVKLLRWALIEQEIRSVKLMFFNKQEKDILWRTSLDELANENPKFEVSYVLSDPPTSWPGAVGRIRSHLLEEFLPVSAILSDAFVCLCGPIPFAQEGLRILKELKFPTSQIHAFQE